jgi:succinoglycan biosynthesis protein ExoO
MSEGFTRSANSIDVSYVIPAYNAAEHIGDAVRSGLAQSDVHVEVIVVDDASSDETVDVIARMGRESVGRSISGEPSVKLIRLPKNGGPSHARNAGIKAARGRWIGILDADDALEPDRTRHLLGLAEASGAQIVADNFSRITGAGRNLSTAFPAGLEPYSFIIAPAEYLGDNIPMGTGFASGYLKPMFRASLLSPDVGEGASAIRYDEEVRVGEDFLFCLEAMLAGGLYVVSSRPGYRYSVREGSLSHRISTGSIDHLQTGTNRLRMRWGHRSTPAINAAFEHYLGGLERTRSFLAVTEQAKSGSVLDAVSTAGRNPDIWPLVARFGMEAVMKRAGLRRR